MHSTRFNPGTERAFTLTEMLIAVAVLAVVILATSTIFGTAQRIASLGQANSDLLQQAAAIEQRIRTDVDRMSRDGFLAIQCVGVRNDINVAQTGRRLDPSRADGEEIRCDQLLFFAEGATPSGRFSQSYANDTSDSDRLGIGRLAPAQSTFAAIYYGSGVQMPIAAPGSSGVLLDIDRETTDIFPWSWFASGDVGLTEWTAPSYEEPFGGSNAPLVTPDAHNWLLMRQAVLLADDDGGAYQDDPNWFMGRDWTHGPNSAGSLFYYDNGGTFRFDPWVVNSRVDVAAVDPTELREQVCVSWKEVGRSNGMPDGFSERIQKADVLNAMYLGYPRGEQTAPSMDRMDTMLTNAVLSPNVSDFRVEWTWGDGVGRDTDSMFPNSPLFNGGLPGVVIDGSYLRNGTARSSATPWFGLSDAAFGSAPASAFSPGADSVSDWSHINPDGLNAVRIGPPVGPEFGNFDPDYLVDTHGNSPLSNIELCDDCNLSPQESSGVRRYGAVFGYNATDGIVQWVDGVPLPFNWGPVFGEQVYQSSGGGTYEVANTYSPWPTALRVTFRLHDPQNKLTGGRVFQFVIPVPKPHS